MSARGTRNPQDKGKATVYLPKWLIAKLRTQENQSTFTEKAIIAFTGWVKPKKKVRDDS